MKRVINIISKIRHVHQYISTSHCTIFPIITLLINKAKMQIWESPALSTFKTDKILLNIYGPCTGRVIRACNIMETNKFTAFNITYGMLMNTE